MSSLKKVHKKLKTDKFWNTLFKNSMWAFLGDSLAAVLGLVVTIVLIKLIGSDEYGVLVLGQTYMTIMDVLINVQSWKGVIQYGQMSLVKGDLQLLGKYVQLGSMLDISTAFVCGIVSILLAPVVGNIFGWSGELVMCAQIFSVTIFSHFAGTPTAVLRLANKFNLVALQKFLSALIKIVALGVLFLASNNVTLLSATIVYVATDILGNILLVIFAVGVYRKRFNLRFVFKNHRNIEGQKFIKFTLWGTVSEIVDLPVNYFDMFIVSMLGVDYVSVYKVFKQVIGIFQRVTSPIQQSILPQFSELSAKNMKKEGFEAIRKIRNVILTIGVPLAIVIGISSPIWLRLLYGEVYADNWLVLFMLLLVQMLALSYSAIHPYYLSLDKAKKSALYIFIANVAYMVIAFLLISKIGLFAMVVSFMIQVLLAVGLKIKDIKVELYDKK